MDKSILSTIIGFVLGAITTSLPKLLDYLFENKKHKQVNQRLYFKRKLNILQAYVATCTQLSASNFNNAIAVEQMKYFNFFGEQDAMHLMVINNIDNHVNASQKIIQQMADLSSAASMFVDLKINPQTAYDLIKSIHVDIAKLGKITFEVNDVINRHQFESEPSLKVLGGKEYFEKKEAYQNHLQNISDNYNKVKTNLNNCIKEVRAEFKKYEA